MPRYEATAAEEVVTAAKADTWSETVFVDDENVYLREYGSQWTARRDAFMAVASAVQRADGNITVNIGTLDVKGRRGDKIQVSEEGRPGGQVTSVESIREAIDLLD